jgi:hypothetical protein
MHKRLATGLGAILLGTILATSGTTPAAATNIQASGLNATIALSNCSASLVRYPSSLDSDPALMLTNGHCYEGGFLSAGQVLQNKPSTRSGTLLNDSGKGLGTLRTSMLLYATMTGTDVSLYRLNTTFGAIKTSYGVTALTLSNTHPVDGTRVTIPSSYWRQTWSCQVNGFVYKLREDQWSWNDSIRYNMGCDTIHGTSGSPVVDSGTGQVIGINNTGSDDGGSCTLNNPCEVDAAGNVVVHQGQGYGQETYWFTTCLSPSNVIDLNIPGCMLTKPVATDSMVAARS